MIALVDCNNFFVSCERAMDPSLAGKAVAVLSNSDGCCVSRSEEFKAMGIPMGTPRFKIRDKEDAGAITLIEADHELYSRISRQVMGILADEASLVEQYSVDEAFIHPPPFHPDGGMPLPLTRYARKIRRRVLSEAKIPCAIGIAKTKTLAKVANHIAKRLPSGVFQMPNDESGILASLDVGEVWGIGRKLSAKFKSMGIRTAIELRDAPDNILKEVGGITAVRTARELRGEVMIGEHHYDETPESISCSRVFVGKRVTTCDELFATIARYASECAAKLRKHGLFASGCNVFAQFGPTLERMFTARTVEFDHPLRDTNDILKAIRPVSEEMFTPGLEYRKSGVTFFGLVKSDLPPQTDLFTPPPERRTHALYETIDRLNEALPDCQIECDSAIVR